MLTRRAKRFRALTAAITASTDSARPATTCWPGETKPATLTPGKSAINASVASTSRLSNATAPWPASWDINRDRIAIARNPSETVSAPATTAAVTSPIECPITASGFTP